MFTRNICWCEPCLVKQISENIVVPKSIPQSLNIHQTTVGHTVCKWSQFSSMACLHRGRRPDEMSPAAQGRMSSDVRHRSNSPRLKADLWSGIYTQIMVHGVCWLRQDTSHHSLHNWENVLWVGETCTSTVFWSFAASGFGQKHEMKIKSQV